MLLKSIRYRTLSCILFVAVALPFFITCKSGNTVNVEFEDGISEPIRELIGEDLLNVLENELGFTIYRGKNPPNVESRLLSSSSSIGQATVKMRPVILVATNVPNDANPPGGRFRDTLFRFTNQDNKNLMVDFDRIVLGSDPFLGDNSFIIGKGKKFTIFGKQLHIEDQDTVVSVNFLSGTIEDNGIREAMGGIMVVKNQGLESFIPRGTGRVFKDEDDFSELGKWPSTGEGTLSKVDGDSTNIERLSQKYLQAE